MPLLPKAGDGASGVPTRALEPEGSDGRRRGLPASIRPLGAAGHHPTVGHGDSFGSQQF
jgi:hypothetical protein